MEIAVGPVLKLIESLVQLINDLRRAPALVKKINSQLQQLKTILVALDKKANTYILTPEEIGCWEDNQRICDKLLRQTLAIVSKLARGRNSPFSLMNNVACHFEARGDLLELYTAIPTSVKYFEKFAKITLKDAVAISSLEGAGISTDCIAMSIEQFARMHRE